MYIKKRYLRILLPLLVLVAVYLYYTGPETELPKGNRGQRVYVLPLHTITDENVLKINEDQDIAYILDFEETYGLVEGSRIEFSTGTKGTVNGIGTTGFTVKPDSYNKIVSGISGSLVTFEGDVVGSVSYVTEGNVWCLFY